MIDSKDAGGRRTAIDRLLLVLGGLCALAGLVALFGGESLRGPYVAAATTLKKWTYSPTPFSTQQAQAAFEGFSSDLGRTAFTGLAVVAIAWLARRRTLNASLASVLVLGALLFSLWPVGRQIMDPVIGDPVEKSLDYGRDDTVEFLEKAGPWGTFRVLAPYEQQPNRLAGFGIATLGGMHAAKPRLMQDLIDAHADASPIFWRLLNVKYLVFDRPIDPSRLPPYLQLVHQGSTAIYEDMLALPRATVVGAYGVVPDTGRADIDSILAVRHDPAEFTWLSKDPGVTLGPVNGATATITKYDLQEVDVTVDTPGPGLLRLSDMWYPDWKATVNGKPAPILRADHALRAVVVPAGKSEVRFRYESASIRAGLWLSIGSALVALALLAAGWLVDRRRRGAPAGAEAA